jgi:hypothetical protein
MLQKHAARNQNPMLGDMGACAKQLGDISFFGAAMDAGSTTRRLALSEVQAGLQW